MAFASGSTIVLFNTLAEWFERIQLARSFKQDYAIHQMKLDIMQVRLSRWGEAYGINKGGPRRATTTTATAAHHAPDPPEDDHADADAGVDDNALGLGRAVRNLLEQILDLFEKAQEDWERLTRQAGDGGADRETLDPDRDMPARLSRLRSRLLGCLAKRRAQAGQVGRNMKWAFYEKEHFEKFFAELSGLVDSLEKLIPEERRDKLRELSQEECADISKMNLESLREMAADQQCDPWMELAADEAIKEKTAAAAAAAAGGAVMVRYNYGGMVMRDLNGSMRGVSFGRSRQVNTWKA